MKRAMLFLTGAIVLVKLAQRSGLACWVRGYHHEEKAGYLPGGYRCMDCRQAVDNGAGYVKPVRKTFERTHETVTRTPYWEESSRGTH